MNFQHENQLLKIIKFLPSIFLISITLISLFFLYFENLKSFNIQKEEISKNYITKNKDLIKERINNTYNYIEQMQKNTEEQLIHSLKEEMNKAYSIANAIYEQNKNSLDEKTIKKLIKDAIRPIRFNNNRGYFFIHDKSAFSNTMHPIMPRLEGRNSYNVKDAKGNYIIRQMHEELKKSDETAFEWYWYKPGNKTTQFKKIGYIRNFKPYNWFIGTGEYVIDFEKQLQKTALERISSTKYNEMGYIFVTHHDGTILNYFKKELIGKNINDFPHSKQDTINIIKLAKEQGEGYYTYSSIPNPKDNVPSKKTSYIKNIEKWNWIIGTGFYEDDINSTIEQKKKELDKNILTYMQNSIIVSIVLALVLLILSFYLARVVGKKFHSYKKEIDQHLKDKSEQQHILSQQAKMASMGEMIGNIAHQWRQPLSNISTHSTSMLVQKEIGVLDDETLKKGLKEINDKAQFLSFTIDDFRNFFNSNKNKSIFKLEDCIKETLTLLESSIKTNQIVIDKNIDDIKILNYKNELIQVLMNILNNAIDVLKEKELKALIKINTKVKKDKVTVSILDNAGGINKDIMDKIFDPYFTTKHKTQGTGIGLYMSNEIITKHMKGLIKVSNKNFTYKNNTYTGALFEITIPTNTKEQT